MNSNFEKAVAFTLQNEGGFTNNPFDSGGATNFGITQSDLASWRGHPVTPDDVKNMTQGEASSIYFMRFWQPLSCDKMAQIPVAITIFDSGVLYGLHTAAVATQVSLSISGFPNILTDGHIGPETLSALNTVDAHLFVISYNVALKNRIRTIVAQNPKNAVFVQGWTARADKLLTLA